MKSRNPLESRNKLHFFIYIHSAYYICPLGDLTVKDKFKELCRWPDFVLYLVSRLPADELFGKGGELGLARRSPCPLLFDNPSFRLIVLPLKIIAACKTVTRGLNLHVSMQRVYPELNTVGAFVRRIHIASLSERKCRW